jgi:hypothetical protein
VAKVYLTSCCAEDDPPGPGLNEFTRLVACRSIDRFGVHPAVGTPEEADIIIFAEVADISGPTTDRILQSPTFRAFSRKCIQFNPRLKSVPTIPGVYASMSRRWSVPGHATSSHYLQTTLEANDIEVVPHVDKPYLFSFCGSTDTWAGRRRIMNLASGNALLRDTSTAKDEITSGSGTESSDYRMGYVRSLHESLFVLCPRGFGPASLRVFEVIKAGRVPVIISDDWARPTGPDWDSFSVTIREDELDTIPEVLEALEPRAREMGTRARRAHDEWFAADVSYHRIVEWGMDILANSATSEARSIRRRLTVEHAVRRIARVAKRTITSGARMTRR